MKTRNPLPVNVAPADRELFESNAEHLVPELERVDLRDVFVTRSGFVLRNFRLVPQSHQKVPLRFSLRFIAIAAHNRVANRVVRMPDSEPYVVAHNLWSIGGYYHWVAESLPRLWRVRNEAPKTLLLLPEAAKQFRFISESVAPLRFKATAYLPSGAIARVPRLILPTHPEEGGTFEPTSLAAIAEYYRSECGGGEEPHAAWQKIYVSRAKAGRRKVKNEEEVRRLVARMGFQVVHLEGYSFADQVSLFSRARVVLGVHGAGLANAAFMRSGGAVVELHRRPVGREGWFAHCYWSLATAARHRYFYQFCTPADQRVGLDSADLLVDIPRLEETLTAATPE